MKKLRKTPNAAFALLLGALGLCSTNHSFAYPFGTICDVGFGGCTSDCNATNALTGTYGYAISGDAVGPPTGRIVVGSSPSGAACDALGFYSDLYNNGGLCPAVHAITVLVNFPPPAVLVPSISTFAINVNARRPVGVFKHPSGSYHAFIKGLPNDDLRTLGGENSVGYGSNGNNGFGGNEEIVGTSQATSGSGAPFHAFATVGQIIGAGDDLQPSITAAGLAGDNSVAYAVNNYKRVVGTAESVPTGLQTFLSASDIGGLRGILPFSSTGLGEYHAFVYNGVTGITHDLGTFPGGWNSVAFGIDNYNNVVGTSQDASGNYRAFQITLPITLTTASGVANLGTLGGLNSIAYGVNRPSAGVVEVVGSSQDMFGAWHAFYKNTGTTMVDLSLLPFVVSAGWTLIQATGINNFGQVVGTGINPNGQIRAFILSP